MTFARIAAALAVGVALAGCGTKDRSSNSSRCPAGMRCNSSLPGGPVHAKRADGSVGVTVDQAWPDRPIEPDPLTGFELAQACAVMAACDEIEQPDAGTIEGIRRIVLALCAQPGIDAPPGAGPGSYFWEERVVPGMDRNERWTFEGS